MKKIFLSLVLFGLMKIGFSQACVENLNVTDFYNNVNKKDSNTVLLDVRTPAEFQEKHIEGSVLIDFESGKFEQEIAFMDKSKNYLVYCKRGGRSASALVVMKQKGFSSVHHLVGGIDDWEKAGYPTVK